MVEIRPGQGGATEPSGVPVGANPDAQSGPGTPSYQNVNGPSAGFSAGFNAVGLPPRVSQAVNNFGQTVANAAVGPPVTSAASPPELSPRTSQAINDFGLTVANAAVGSSVTDGVSPTGLSAPSSTQGFTPQGRAGGLLGEQNAENLGGMSNQGFDNVVTAASMQGFNDLATGFGDVVTAAVAYGYAIQTGKLLDPQQVDALTVGGGNPASLEGGATSPGGLINGLPKGASLTPPSGAGTTYWTVNAPNGQTWYFNSSSQANAAVASLSYYTVKNPYTGQTVYFSSKGGAEAAIKQWGNILTVGKLAGEVGQTAAYIFPGGAILHGIGDTQEGLAARIFDIGAGSLMFIPGIGELGASLGTVARVGIGAGVGAAFSGVGSALHGGSLTQDFESAALGGVLGATGAYFLPKAMGALRGNPEADFTETITGQNGTKITLKGAPPVGGDALDNAMEIGPEGEPIGAPPGSRPVGQGLKVDSPLETAPPRDLADMLQEMEGRMPNKGSGFLENEEPPVPTRPSVSYSKGAPSEPWDMPGSSTDRYAFSYKGMDVIRGGPGAVDRGEIDFGNNDPFKGHTQGFGGKDTSAPVETGGGGQVSEQVIEQSPADVTTTSAFNEESYRSLYTPRSAGSDSDLLYLTTPPSYHGPTTHSKSIPIQTDISLQTPASAQNTEGAFTFVWPHPGSLYTPFDTPTPGPTTIPPQQKVTTDTTNVFTTPIPSLMTEPTPTQSPKQVTPSLFTFYSNDVFAPGYSEAPQPKNNLPFPGLLTPFGGQGGGRRGHSGFAYDLKVHDLGDLLSLGSGKSKRKNPFAL